MGIAVLIAPNTRDGWKADGIKKLVQHIEPSVTACGKA